MYFSESITSETKEEVVEDSDDKITGEGKSSKMKT